MSAEESNKNNRQVRPRSRMSTDGVGYGRADYLNRPEQMLQPTTRPVAPARPIQVVSHDAPTQPVAPPPEPVVVEVVPEPALPAPAPTVLDAAPVPLEINDDFALDIEPVNTEETIDENRFAPPEQKEKKRRRILKLPKIKRSSFRVSRRVFAGLTAIALVTSAGSGFALVASSHDSSSGKLEQALNNALSVTSVEQSTGQTVVNYNFANQKEPIISGTFDTRIAGIRLMAPPLKCH